MIVTLDEAKEYLRIDTADEDITVQTLLSSAQKICMDVARIDEESEFDSLNDIGKTAVLYTLGYYYENRADADYSKLTKTLRSLLFSVREGR